MTFNVQFYKTSKTPTKIAKFLLNHQPDVVCLQENIQYHNWTKAKFAPLNLSSYYILGAECEADKHHHSHLSNMVYVHRKHLKHVQTLYSVNLIILNETQRCAGSIQLYDTKISNVHLCGGRYDDQIYDRLQEHKHLQLERLIKTHNPDIIMGDFNSEDSDEAAMKQLDQYPFYKTLNKTNKELFVHYYMSGARYLRDQTTYVPAYNESSIGVTSAFGGTPDWIYVKDRTRLTGKIYKYDATTTNLSDHNAVIVEYLFSYLSTT
ncbi:unnamed protein product [Rotaria sp. Silwood1]|nr:unnamed protein product [Rotaria sp. Silwood1]CAF1169784.1 unnamed protein product [Rotaria sp. Silwood1]CAF3469579.1 unnamed protein product [Rotaria sp. Silwood1]CAF3499573.1 unnamed protein product [Rotaria sp. Silwood1]CAF4629561.1 unnamed protein product [Rotaria sp. Silwood1]